jgi:hypothetical protein
MHPLANAQLLRELTEQRQRELAAGHRHAQHRPPRPRRSPRRVARAIRVVALALRPGARNLAR